MSSSNRHHNPEGQRGAGQDQYNDHAYYAELEDALKHATTPKPRPETNADNIRRRDDLTNGNVRTMNFYGE